MKKNFLGKNWFFEDFMQEEELTSTWGFKIEKELYSGKSSYQKFEVFNTKEFGKVLVLDGFIQFMEKSEHIYHEMLIHPAMTYCDKSFPEKVLIIGGGDGLAAREILKYPVKELIICDIDKKVTEVTKKHFKKNINSVFEDKRLKIINEDALNFVKKYKQYFDFIVEDLTDPSPVSEFCWNNSFYKDIFNSLKEKGIVAFQTGCLEDTFSKKVRKDISKIFPYFKTHKAFVSSFPYDEYTFSFASKKIDFNKLTLKKTEAIFKRNEINVRYYSPEIHHASTVLPKKFQI